ncbi:Uncharacterised protein [Mycobacteroides abscessus subsp. abscessus]|nr:Uncharacterised protein [Mycobacteroides abscessus subsp. abscessus]
MPEQGSYSKPVCKRADHARLGSRSDITYPARRADRLPPTACQEEHGGPDQEARGHSFHSAKLLPALLVDGRITHREDTTGCFPPARLIAVLACHVSIIRHGAHYAPPRAPSSSIGYR